MAVYITNVSPKAFLTGQSRDVTLTGGGFSGTVTVVINGSPIPVYLRTDGLVRFVMPYVPAGSYDVNVTNGDGSNWIIRQAITVTDQPNAAPLGSAQRPIVLPTRMIESAATATLNTASKYRVLASAARLTFDTITGDYTGTLAIDSSSVPQEPISVQAPQAGPQSGQVLITPWGTFKNG